MFRVLFCLCQIFSDSSAPSGSTQPSDVAASSAVAGAISPVVVRTVDPPLYAEKIEQVKKHEGKIRVVQSMVDVSQSKIAKLSIVRLFSWKKSPG